MGSCVSVYKLSIESNGEKLLIPSPVKQKPDMVNAGDFTVADVESTKFSPVRFRRAAGGSKDESFFDSQPWLESDCEDDYYSVNGDFTPSRGNTPVHHSLLQQVNKSPISEPSKKKRLSELFKESLHDIDDENATTPKSMSATPYLSGISSETTPNGLLREEEKSAKYAQCCIPRLLRERKNKASPTNSVGSSVKIFA